MKTKTPALSIRKLKNLYPACTVHFNRTGMTEWLEVRWDAPHSGPPAGTVITRGGIHYIVAPFSPLPYNSYLAFANPRGS